MSKLEQVINFLHRPKIHYFVVRPVMIIGISTCLQFAMRMDIVLGLILTVVGMLALYLSYTWVEWWNEYCKKSKLNEDAGYVDQLIEKLEARFSQLDTTTFQDRIVYRYGDGHEITLFKESQEEVDGSIHTVYRRRDEPNVEHLLADFEDHL